MTHHEIIIGLLDAIRDTVRDTPRGGDYISYDQMRHYAQTRADINAYYDTVKPTGRELHHIFTLVRDKKCLLQLDAHDRAFLAEILYIAHGGSAHYTDPEPMTPISEKCAGNIAHTIAVTIRAFKINIAANKTHC